jgi:probable F420-dependent oxidoreductase
MKFSVALPTGMEGLMYPVPFTTPETLATIAQTAEELGFDSVWANDHVTTQEYVAKEWGTPPNYFCPVMSLSFIAAKTETIKLATGVAVLPLRDPVILAKQMTTLDHLSCGRVILGTGLGAYKEEFKAVHPGIPLSDRGKMVDESLAALTALFTQGKTSFFGNFYRFKDVELFPKPYQEVLPMYIGGNAKKGTKRVAQYGTGWFPAVLSPGEINSMLTQMKKDLKKEGRSLNEIDVAPQFGICIADTREKAIKNFKKSQVYKHLLSLSESTLKGKPLKALEERNLVGSPDDIIKKVDEYEKVGVTHMAGLIFAGNSRGDIVEQMTLLAREVVPSF